jgi:hypothetical protein
MRRLSFIPEHFTTVIIKDTSIDIKMLDHWINYNLNSRYAIKKSYTLDDRKRIIEGIEIGMEDPKELTMVTLGCPYLHKN